MTVQQLDENYIVNTYNRFPVVLQSGHGSLVTDENGKEYIDLATGIAVNTFGVADAEWQQAVAQQAATLQHTSNLYYSRPCAELARLLVNKTGMAKVFFSNSGAEANECAIKAARKYAALTKGKDYYHIITLKNSFHGRTVTTLAATGQAVFHNDFTPLTEGFLYAEPNNLGAVSRLLNRYRCAAVMLEVVQGEGGVQPLDPDYLTALAQLLKQKDVLLICDEVQIGNGRSGQLYGYMNYRLQPDIFTTAKGLAGGLPLGATVFSKKTAGVLTPGTHGSTFGGNPVCCAGALSILSRLNEQTLQGVRKRSEFIVKELTGAPGITAVTGLGLMLGLQTVRPAAQVIANCLAQGVLVISAKNKVRLLPALNIPMPLLQKAVEVIKAVCAAGEEEV